MAKESEHLVHYVPTGGSEELAKPNRAACGVALSGIISVTSDRKQVRCSRCRRSKCYRINGGSTLISGILWLRKGESR